MYVYGSVNKDYYKSMISYEYNKLIHQAYLLTTTFSSIMNFPIFQFLEFLIIFIYYIPNFRNVETKFGAISQIHGCLN